MYRWFVERQVRATFRQLSAGDFETSVGQLPSHLTHSFPGDHALGGERQTPEQMRRWFARLYTIFPDLRFDVHRVVVRGWPWDTTVAVEWSDHATPPDGVRYDNEGTHFIRLVRGKIVSLHAYCDSQKIADVCARLGARGMAEALALPIDARVGTA